MKPAYKMTALSPYPGKGLCLAGRAACCTRPSGLPAVFFFRGPYPVRGCPAVTGEAGAAAWLAAGRGGMPKNK